MSVTDQRREDWTETLASFHRTISEKRDRRDQAEPYIVPMAFAGEGVTVSHTMVFAGRASDNRASVLTYCQELLEESSRRVRDVSGVSGGDRSAYLTDTRSLHYQVSFMSGCERG